MIDISLLYTVLISFLAVILVYIAFLDFLYYQIPNTLLVLISLLFLVWVVASEQYSLLENIEYAILFMAVGWVLSFYNIFGEGDSKLLAVLSLWLGGQQILHMLLGMSLIGGVLALIILFLGKYVHKIRQILWNVRFVRKINSFVISNIEETEAKITFEEYKKMVPYGIAIAAAGILCFFTKVGDWR